MLEHIPSFLRVAAGTQAADLPQLPPPKVKPKQQALPSYVKNARSTTTSDLPQTDRQTANTDLLTLRTGTSTKSIIRDYIKVVPDLSNSVYAYLRTAITASYTAVVRNMDGSFNREGTLLLQQLMTRFDEVTDYSDGFSGIWSLRSISESLGKELLTYGACSMELVLDRGRLPRSIVPVSTSQIRFQQDDAWLRPFQVVGSERIDLDVPTFFYVALDQDLLEAYSDSPLEAAVQAVLADTDFFNDLRRLVKRALHPRLDVEIDEEAFRKSVPAEVLLDPAALKSYTDNVMTQVQTLVNDLNPEDALIHFGFLKFTYLNHGNSSPAQEEETLMNMARSRMASGAKSMPAVLGHGDTGTQNVASTQSLLFMKSAVGAVQEKINELYSRCFTLAIRLFGIDGYAEFRYAAVDLRPENELEAFRSMKQSRVLQLLSLGFITDDEASIQLTGNVTPAGFAPLAGTGFMSAGAQEVAANGYSTTGSQGTKEGSLNQSLKPGTPQSPKTAK